MCLWPGLWATPRPPGVHVYSLLMEGLLCKRLRSSHLRVLHPPGTDWETEAQWNLRSEAVPSPNSLPTRLFSCECVCEHCVIWVAFLPVEDRDCSRLLSPDSPPAQLASPPTWTFHLCPKSSSSSFFVCLVAPGPSLSPTHTAMPRAQDLWSLLDNAVLPQFSSTCSNIPQALIISYLD